MTKSVANISQHEGPCAVSLFSIFFTTFRPENLFAFTRTQFTAAADCTRL